MALISLKSSQLQDTCYDKVGVIIVVKSLELKAICQAKALAIC
jgi:hypothetical protein